MSKGCGLEKFYFPKDFLWGAATSSHQVEGGNINNDWWEWEAQKKTKDPSGRACDQYNRFRDDFNLAKELNHNAHRFSLEWSRIEPKEKEYNKEALDHYREMVKVLRSLGMEPVVTINHFTLPLWLSRKGGWTYEGMPRHFAEFSEKAAEYIGEDVTYWITINEPIVCIYASYVEGSWPPGRHSLKEAAAAFVNMLKAHALSYIAIRKIYKGKNWLEPKISISKHVLLFSPCRKDSALDNFSAGLRHFYFNRLFIDALVRGRLAAPGLGITRLPVKKSLDFLGINYYTKDFIHYAGLIPSRIFGNVCTLFHHQQFEKRNFLSWEIYPEGMYNVLKEYSRYGLPIMIAENGICTNDDNDRIDFIKGHLKETARAMKEGVTVLGYLHWSLLDNFEWFHGYGPRFGLVEVDYATQRRTIKPSARLYADIIKNNSI